MSLVTTFGVIPSTRHDALSLISFATFGGFMTPVILRAETSAQLRLCPSLATSLF
ncbi:MAG: hypothetical protein NZ805_08855 [Armatimonadetes bacterium]|nr:hypothetical protein [Armatimonadota bacterium]